MYKWLWFNQARSILFLADGILHTQNEKQFEVRCECGTANGRLGIRAMLQRAGHQF